MEQHWVIISRIATAVFGKVFFVVLPMAIGACGCLDGSEHACRGYSVEGYEYEEVVDAVESMGLGDEFIDNILDNVIEEPDEEEDDD